MVNVYYSPPKNLPCCKAGTLYGWAGSRVRVLGLALRILEITTAGNTTGRADYSWHFVPVFATELCRMN
jgi:hypothetical protein